MELPAAACLHLAKENLAGKPSHLLLHQDHTAIRVAAMAIN